MLILEPVKHSASNLKLKHLMSKALIALFALVLLSSLSCGKRRPPLPPTERVSQRVVLSGFQRGSNIILSWKMPARNAAKGSVLNISRADIYRLAEPTGAALTLSEEEFASRSVLIATVPVADKDFGLKSLGFQDRLELVDQPARLRYSVRLANASGQKGAFSNFVVIEPLPRVASAPTSLIAAVSQESITLNWNAPKENIDRSAQVNLLGFYVYRSTSENEPAKLLTKSPVTGTTYRDEYFEFGKQYYYFVRAVSASTEAVPIESDESNIVKIKPIDTFAPAPPSAITLAAGQNIISIFFAINVEKDIAGYRIYRSDDPALPKQQWVQLTSELLKTNTFQDRSVTPGKTYYYFLTATDTSRNVSEASEVVSETVPK